MRIGLAILLLTTTSAFGARHYTFSMFRRAMAKDNMAVSGVMSDAPLFTLVILPDPKTSLQRETCVLSSFLAGAIHSEYHLPCDSTGERKQFEIAMSHRARVFAFNSRDARNHVEPPHYTPQQLAEVHRRLAHKTAAQLRREVGRPGSDVTLLSEQPYQPRKYPWLDGWCTVVAHVLLERGILVGLTHTGPTLYLDERSNHAMHLTPSRTAFTFYHD